LKISEQISIEIGRSSKVIGQVVSRSAFVQCPPNSSI